MTTLLLCVSATATWLCAHLRAGQDATAQRQAHLARPARQTVAPAGTDVLAHAIAEVRAERAGRDAPIGIGTCRRCGGTGNLPHFAHVQGGMCFRCEGDGREPERWLAEGRENAHRIAQQARRTVQSTLTLTMESGHYATTNSEGNLSFYRIDKVTEGRWAGFYFVHHITGPNEDRVGRQAPDGAYRGQHESLIRAINENPVDAMRAYGQNIGRCGRCHRRLTNAESRAFGLGPECRNMV
jgi:hypothetical protein